MKFAIALALCWFSALIAGAAPGGVVINELMYHPPDDREDLQFIEPFNPGSAAVDLAGWGFKQGVEFRFPEKTVIAAGGYLIVARDTNALVRHYGREITNAPLAGNFGGKLSHNGETISLTNRAGQLVDSVKYSDRGAWPRGADGYSASLERITPEADGNEAASWSASTLPAALRAAGTPGRRNDGFLPTLPPIISDVRFVEVIAPNQPITVTATVSESATRVTLLWQTFTDNARSTEQELPMKRSTGSQYEATMAGQPSGTLTRFRIRASDASGATRIEPGPNEPRPTFSALHFDNTNTARIPFAFLTRRGEPEPMMPQAGTGLVVPEPTRGNGTFVVAETNRGAVLLFDHVRLQPRKGGWKVHFQKDHAFHGMTGLNVTFESPRWVLSEPLGFEVFRRAGVPAPETDFVRLWENGRLSGYSLTFEQENKAFLERNQRDSDGDLFKLLWYGSGLIGQHEKKSNAHTGHTNLSSLEAALRQRRGDAQWEVIRDRFNVEEVASYFAGCQLIANWDGFHNNQFIFQDVSGTGKWEIYPWDLDKTFGDFDDHPSDYAWYTMPLTAGMEGDRPPIFGSSEWFRAGGWFSRPLLANAEFRARFLARVRALCEAEFTEAKLLPWINEMERRLEPEVPVRASAQGQPASQALERFHADIESVRRFIAGRREFLLRELHR